LIAVVLSYGISEKQEYRTLRENLMDNSPILPYILNTILKTKYRTLKENLSTKVSP
jgi:hypothetical protein